MHSRGPSVFRESANTHAPHNNRVTIPSGHHIKLRSIQPPDSPFQKSFEKRTLQPTTDSNELQPLFAHFLGCMDLEKEMIGRETGAVVRSQMLRELVDKYCTVAPTGTSCDDAFNATTHNIQKHRGMFFVHKTPGQHPHHECPRHLAKHYLPTDARESPRMTTQWIVSSPVKSTDMVGRRTISPEAGGVHRYTLN